MVPLYLGISYVIGVICQNSYGKPCEFRHIALTFVNENDYDNIEQGDSIVIEDAVNQIKRGDELIVKNITKGTEFNVKLALSPRLKEIILAGGLLNYTRKNS